MNYKEMTRNFASGKFLIKEKRADFVSIKDSLSGVKVRTQQDEARVQNAIKNIESMNRELRKLNSENEKLRKQVEELKSKHLKENSVAGGAVEGGVIPAQSNEEDDEHSGAFSNKTIEPKNPGADASSGQGWTPVGEEPDMAYRSEHYKKKGAGKKVAASKKDNLPVTKFT